MVLKKPKLKFFQAKRFPNLVYEKINELTDRFEEAYKILPKNSSAKEMWPEFAGKLMVLDYMLTSASFEQHPDVGSV